MASRHRGGRPRPATRARRRRFWWAHLDYEELLDLRISDLGLRIEGTALEQRIQRLHDELSRAGLRFRPYVWLSTDWFTPDGVTGFAVPFFLAHPRLVRIEHRKMFEAEGGNSDWCMKLLRHETGHAIDNAYRLHWKPSWRRTFGKFTESYKNHYNPRTRSRKYVLHLDHWYSHSHPAEDFAETFAVWLQPGSRWRRTYAAWPALKKLEYVDELMADIGDQPPKVRSREKPDSASRLRITLREHYRRQEDRYAGDLPSVYDRQLARLFPKRDGPVHRNAQHHAHRETAASFLRRSRHELRDRVAATTGHYRYVVDQALKMMIGRCRELELLVTRPKRETRLEATILLTMMTMGFLHGRGHEYRR